MGRVGSGSGITCTLMEVVVFYIVRHRIEENIALFYGLLQLYQHIGVNVHFYCMKDLIS